MGSYNTPSTPPRSSHNHRPITPSSSRCSKPSHTKHLSGGTRIHSLTPGPTRRHAFESLSPPSSKEQSLLLPSPVTSSSKRTKDVDEFRPSLKSKTLTQSLEVLRDDESLEMPKEENPFNLLHQNSTPCARPSTPPLQITENKYLLPTSVKEDEDNEGTVQVVDIDFLRSIPRKPLPNPFVEPSTPPRQSSHKSNDLDICLEKINSRTGTKKVEQLPDDLKRLKPKRLDFSLVENTKCDIANKFVKKTMGRTFVTENSPKLGFKIFSDDMNGKPMYN